MFFFFLFSSSSLFHLLPFRSLLPLYNTGYVPVKAVTSGCLQESGFPSYYGLMMWGEVSTWSLLPQFCSFFFPTALMVLMQQCVPPLSHKCLSVQVLLSFINSLTLKESRRRTALSRRWGMSWISVHAVFLLVPVRRCNIAATFIVSTTAVSSCLW